MRVSSRTSESAVRWQVADHRTEFSIRRSWDLRHGFEDDTHVAEARTDLPNDLLAVSCRECRGRDVADSYQINFLLDHLSFPNGQSDFECRIKTADRPAVGSVQGVIATAFDALQDGQRAAARTGNLVG